MTSLPSYAAIGLSVFVAAASGSGAEDFVLLLPTGERVCAKSADDCAAAQEAIRRGWWPVAAPEAETVCKPAPGCFPLPSLVIRGYNAR